MHALSLIDVLRQTLLSSKPGCITDICLGSLRDWWFRSEIPTSGRTALCGIRWLDFDSDLGCHDIHKLSWLAVTADKCEGARTTEHIRLLQTFTHRHKRNTEIWRRNGDRAKCAARTIGVTATVVFDKKRHVWRAGCYPAQ